MAYIVPTLEDFRTLFPELNADSFPDATVNFWFAQAIPFFDQARWDDLLFLGMLYWVAHSAYLAKLNSTTQALDDGVMKKVGDIAKTRDATLMLKANDEPLYRTSYGALFMNYRAMVGSGGFAV